MAGEKVTATQVAERAGVSQSAVSRVFTPGASVSRKTAEKVRKVAEEMGYRPNVLARSLITGRSRIIGVVVAYFENQFYPDAVEKLSNALQREGYHVLIFMASQTAGNIDGVLDEIIDYQVDGLIMASVAMSSELAERCEAAGIPVGLVQPKPGWRPGIGCYLGQCCRWPQSGGIPAGGRPQTDRAYRRVGRGVDTTRPRTGLCRGLAGRRAGSVRPYRWRLPF